MLGFGLGIYDIHAYTAAKMMTNNGLVNHNPARSTKIQQDSEHQNITMELKYYTISHHTTYMYKVQSSVHICTAITKSQGKSTRILLILVRPIAYR